MLSNALQRGLTKQGIKIKPNFEKTFGAYYLAIDKGNTSEEEKMQLKKEVSRQVFVLLNRANSTKKGKKSTSPLTAMIGNNKKKLGELGDLGVIKIISQDEMFPSITGMQHGRGMISKQGIDLLNKIS